MQAYDAAQSPADGGTFGGLELAQLVGALVALAPFLLEQPQLWMAAAIGFCSTAVVAGQHRLFRFSTPWLHALTVLVLHQLGKQSRCLAKLRIGPDLNDAALVHHHNPIGSLHRA